ncbi:hypothetical protein CH063_06231, partial [Colletotrichum higginsianum]
PSFLKLTVKGTADGRLRPSPRGARGLSRRHPNLPIERLVCWTFGAAIVPRSHRQTRFSARRHTIQSRPYLRY